MNVLEKKLLEFTKNYKQSDFSREKTFFIFEDNYEALYDNSLKCFICFLSDIFNNYDELKINHLLMTDTEKSLLLIYNYIYPLYEKENSGYSTYLFFEYVKIINNKKGLESLIDDAHISSDISGFMESHINKSAFLYNINKIEKLELNNIAEETESIQNTLFEEASLFLNSFLNETASILHEETEYDLKELAELSFKI